MSDKHKKILNKLGFDTSLEGAEYFISISEQLQESLELLEGNIEEIPDYMPKNKDEMYDFIDRICVDDSKFYYECGRNNYLKELDFFINSRIIKDEKQKKLNTKIFGNCRNRETMLLRFANYIYSIEKKLANDKKLFVKKLNY